VFYNRVLKRTYLDLRGSNYEEAGENCIMSGIKFVSFTKHYYGSKIKDDEVCGTCGMHL
jgi:hypothetical protein